MSEITYRLIEIKDNQPLAQLIRNVFDEFDVERIGTVYSDASTDNLFDLFAVENAEYWVAEQNGNVIGGCGIYPTDGLGKGCAELVKLYLSPLARGYKVGFNLLNIIIKRSIELGYKQLYLESFDKFSKAVSMYENLGFRHIDAPMGNSGHSACTIWMIKDLENSLS